MRLLANVLGTNRLSRLVARHVAAPLATVIGVGAASLAIAAGAAEAQTRYAGVNLAGAEFGHDTLPGVHGTNYVYPSKEEVDYFLDRGLNTIRLPFLWERLQPRLSSAFAAAELRRLDDLVKHVTGRGGYIVLDVHNYARYRNMVVGSPRLPVKHFQDFWKRLAGRYRSNGRVIIGLMNEPHDMPTEQWLKAANAAVAAIRGAGARNLVLVPGNAWTGAHSWQDDWYGTPNGTVMARFKDPANNFAFEVHQYMDEQFAGDDKLPCNRAVDALRGMERMTSWLRSRGAKGFLGEIGADTSAACLDGLDAILSHLDGNSDIWAGWTYWAAGPWWGDYPYSVEPRDGEDRPQMDVLLEHAP